MGLVAPVNAKDGKEKQRINIATLAGKMETQLGNGGKEARLFIFPILGNL